MAKFAAMKAINIFRPGKHTSSNGTTAEFSEADLRATIDAYDPALHEAPIVVGHPKDNAPAFGWIEKLDYSDDGLEAIPKDVDPDFAELVQAGKYKKVSASFYTPDNPNNPVQGVYYLRHVGFLGAQPPAVKGLRGISFSDDEQGVVEFSAWDDETNASLWRRLRDWLIGKYGVEEADKAIPSYSVKDLEDGARREFEKEAKQNEPINPPSFSENTNMPTVEELQAQVNQLKNQLDAATQQNADFSERENALKQRESAIRKAEVTTYVDDLIRKGQVLPKDKAGLVAFMCSLDATGVVEFTEGDKTTKQSPAEFMKSFLEGMPRLVNFKEHTRDDGDKVDLKSADDIEKAAAEYIEAEAKKGRTVSPAEAVIHVTKNAKA
jgi:hypothetical protein